MTTSDVLPLAQHSAAAEQRVLDAMMAATDPVFIDKIAGRLNRSHFYEERHAVVFDAILALRKDDAPRTADAVTLRLMAQDANAFMKMGGAAYLAEVVELNTTPIEGTWWAARVVERANARDAVAEATRYLQIAETGQPDRIASARHRLLDEWSTIDEPAEGPRGVELDAFLDQDDPEHDWLIRDLLERRDRLILTGGEGRGKSTLLRQIGVQLASGIHPFGGDPFPPLRVLRLDVENGDQREKRALRALRIVAGDQYAGGMVFKSRIEGLDLTDESDRVWFRQLVAEHEPDVILTGPAYKMHGGDPNDETAARVVAAQFDHVRAAHGCAIILEAHSPHASNGGKRPTRPYGASYWLRWPEFGLNLGDDGELTHWRGPRDERDWPALLCRGGVWPWSASARDRDALWVRIKTACVDAGKRLSERDLVAALGASRTSIQRAVKEHTLEWASLASAHVREGGPL